MSEVFDRIYRDNLWAGTDSASGPGSGRVATRPVARAVADLVAELRCATVLDVGCGDGAWLPELPGYLGIDVSAEAVARARARHPDRHYEVAELTVTPGDWDLIIMRDVLQHLPLAEGNRLLHTILDSSARALLASTFIGGANIDVPAGEAYSPDLRAAPFDMWPADRHIFDGYDYERPGRKRDGAKYLGLWLL